MTLAMDTIVRNAAGDAIVGLINSGTARPSGYLELRTAPRPANTQTAPTGTILGTLSFSNPAYPSFAAGQALVNPIVPDSNLVNTGICNWFRIYNRDGIALWDGDVTVTGGGGDIEFNDINFIQGGTISITQLNANYPT